METWGSLQLPMGRRGRYRVHLKNPDGAHLLIVTDSIVNQEAPDPDRPGKGDLGHVYGLLECLLRGGHIQGIE